MTTLSEVQASVDRLDKAATALTKVCEELNAILDSTDPETLRILLGLSTDLPSETA